MPADPVTIAGTFWDNPVVTLQEWVQTCVTSVEEWFGAFSTGDWVLFALALAALLWLVASLRAMARLGPVEVVTLEHDGENAAAVKALTGALREQLHRNGLSPPPAVPAGNPQVDLIAAVEKSGMPQAPFIAKLIELLPSPPRPLEYKVTGTLLGVEPADPPTEAEAEGAAEAGYLPESGPCGLTYWVQPSREGNALLESVNHFHQHRQAVDAAAARIYLHISNDAIHAFPTWARWRHVTSLKAYVDGCRLRRDGHTQEAIARFETAVGREPLNALGRLQLANIYEARVPPEPGLDQARAQSDALQRYLAISSDWPEIVEARYRTSVLASALATTCDELEPEQRQFISTHLALPGVTPDNLSEELRELASRETRAVLQLLRPWYAVLHERRLRNQFEPKAHERRELKRTVAISRHCVGMRALADSAKQRNRNPTGGGYGDAAG